MQNKNNDNSEKHLKNTDNESTMYIPSDSNEYQQNARIYNQQANHGNQQNNTNANPIYNNYNNPNQQYYNGNQQQQYYQNQQYYGGQQQPQQPYYQNQPYYGGQPQPPQRPPAGGGYGRQSAPKKEKRKNAKAFSEELFQELFYRFLLFFCFFSESIRAFH